MRNNYKSETMNNVSLYLACYLSVFCGCFGQLRIGNVALHKTCTIQSSWDDKYKPDKAVNNDTSGEYPKNCIHTGPGQTDTWWEVDLGRSYPVYSITVWAREGHTNKMKKCVITVDGQDCFSFPESDIPSRKINVNCSMGVINGSKVRVSKISSTIDNNVDYTINICEFQVWSCTDPFWGAQCDTKCGNCIGDSVCDKVTGHCSCKPGFQTPLCNEECANGTYGDNCSSVCGGCMHPMFCDKVDGHCSQCEPGLKLPLCKYECDDGTYGQNCSLNCGNCTNNQVCDKKDGTCLSCPPGLIPPLCRQECSAGTYGQDCKSDCGRGCNNNICHSVTGQCECVAGWQQNIGHIDGTVVGLGVAVAVLIIIVIVLLIRDLRRSKNSRQHTTKSTEIEIRNSRPPTEQRTDNADCRENVYDRLDRQEIYDNAKERSVYMDLTSSQTHTVLKS